MVDRVECTLDVDKNQFLLLIKLQQKAKAKANAQCISNDQLLSGSCLFIGGDYLQ